MVKAKKEFKTVKESTKPEDIKELKNEERSAIIDTATVDTTGTLSDIIRNGKNGELKVSKNDDKSPIDTEVIENENRFRFKSPLVKLDNNTLKELYCLKQGEIKTHVEMEVHELTEGLSYYLGKYKIEPFTNEMEFNHNIFKLLAKILDDVMYIPTGKVKRQTDILYNNGYTSSGNYDFLSSKSEIARRNEFRTPFYTDFSDNFDKIKDNGKTFARTFKKKSCPYQSLTHMWSKIVYSGNNFSLYHKNVLFNAYSKCFELVIRKEIRPVSANEYVWVCRTQADIFTRIIKSNLAGLALYENLIESMVTTSKDSDLTRIDKQRSKTFQMLGIGTFNHNVSKSIFASISADRARAMEQCLVKHFSAPKVFKYDIDAQVTSFDFSMVVSLMTMKLYVPKGFFTRQSRLYIYRYLYNHVAVPSFSGVIKSIDIKSDQKFDISTTRVTASLLEFKGLIEILIYIVSFVDGIVDNDLGEGVYDLINERVLFTRSVQIYSDIFTSGLFCSGEVLEIYYGVRPEESMDNLSSLEIHMLTKLKSAMDYIKLSSMHKNVDAAFKHFLGKDCINHDKLSRLYWILSRRMFGCRVWLGWVGPNFDHYGSYSLVINPFCFVSFYYMVDPDPEINYYKDINDVTKPNNKNILDVMACSVNIFYKCRLMELYKSKWRGCFISNSERKRLIKDSITNSHVKEVFCRLFDDTELTSIFHDVNYMDSLICELFQVFCKHMPYYGIYNGFTINAQIDYDRTLYNSFHRKFAFDLVMSFKEFVKHATRIESMDIGSQSMLITGVYGFYTESSDPSKGLEVKMSDIIKRKIGPKLICSYKKRESSDACRTIDDYINTPKVVPFVNKYEFYDFTFIDDFILLNNFDIIIGEI